MNEITPGDIKRWKEEVARARKAIFGEYVSGLSCDGRLRRLAARDLKRENDEILGDLGTEGM